LSAIDTADAGLKVEVVRIEDEAPVGNVVRQDPRAGAEVPADTLVTIYVSGTP